MWILQISVYDKILLWLQMGIGICFIYDWSEQIYSFSIFLNSVCRSCLAKTISFSLSEW